MGYDVSIEIRASQNAAVVNGRVSLADLQEFLGTAFADVLTALDEQLLSPTGPPFGIYRIVEDGFDASAGFPCSGELTPVGDVVPLVLPGGAIATTVHVGSYDAIAAAYGAVGAWLADQGITPTGDPWECYLDGPEVAAPRTIVCVPCDGVPTA